MAQNKGRDAARYSIQDEVDEEEEDQADDVVELTASKPPVIQDRPKLALDHDVLRLLFKLKMANVVAFCFHLIAAIAMFAITEPSQAVPIFFFVSDPAHYGNSELSRPIVIRVGEVSVGYLAPIALLFSALNHAIVSMIWPHSYSKCILNGNNPYRWAEYTITSPLNNFMIAMLAGVTDVHTIFCLIALSAMVILCGWLAEKSVHSKHSTIIFPSNSAVSFDSLLSNAQNANFGAILFWMGCFAFVCVWSIIFCAFTSAASRAEQMPGFVYAIVIVLFLLNCCFAILFYLDHQARINMQGKSPVSKTLHFVHVEMVYIIMSMCAKFCLAFINNFSARNWS